MSDCKDKGTYPYCDRCGSCTLKMKLVPPPQLLSFVISRGIRDTVGDVTELRPCCDCVTGICVHEEIK